MTLDTNKSAGDTIEAFEWNEAATASNKVTDQTLVAADVSDFDTEVSNSTDVAANTADRHTQGTDTTLGTMSAAIDMGDNNIENIKYAGFNINDNGSSGTTATVDWTTGAYQTITLTDNVTLSFTDPFTTTTDVARIELKLVQDGTGARDVTMPGNVVFTEGAPTFTDGTANQKMRITFVYDDDDDQYVAQATSWYD